MWRDLYDVEEELGRGQFGIVVQCVEKSTREPVAIKIISNQKGCGERDAATREVEALEQARGHDRLLQLIDVFSTSTETAVVLEIIKGGELFDYLAKRDVFTEEEAVIFTRQLLDGLVYLHYKMVVHLDLKPENILLMEEGSVASIKIIDFGLARILKGNEHQYETHGTAEFVAPEIVMHRPVSTATDMWAVGVLTYILLSGMSPFVGETDKETFHNIRSVRYEMEEDFAESQVSEDAKDFVQNLLIQDPSARMPADEYEYHPWLKPERLCNRRTSLIVTHRLREFNARRKWHSAVQAVQASSFIRRLSIMRKLGLTLNGAESPTNETEDSHESASSSSSDDADESVTWIPKQSVSHKQATLSHQISTLKSDSADIQEESLEDIQQFSSPQRLRLESSDSEINSTSTKDCKCQERCHSIGTHCCCKYLVYKEGSFDDWRRQDQDDTKVSCLQHKDDSRFSTVTVKSKGEDNEKPTDEIQSGKEHVPSHVPSCSRDMRRTKSDNCLNLA